MISVSAGMAARPVISADRIVVATWSGGVVAVSRDTGAVLWHYDGSGEIDSQLAALGNTVVFTSNAFAPITGIDLQTGQMAWQYRQQAQVVWSLAPIDGHLYIGESEGLWSLDLQTGLERRLLESADVTGPPVIAEGMLYVGSWNGSLYAIR
jgi:outer membrane protein assembly factor BamB